MQRSLKTVLGIVSLCLGASLPSVADDGNPATPPAREKAAPQRPAAPADDEAILQQLREHFPRMAEMAEKLKQNNPERYRDFMDKARRMHEARERFEEAQGAPSPEMEAIQKRIAEIFRQNEGIRTQLRELHAQYTSAAEADRPALRAKIKELVLKAFDLTTERRKLELQERQLHLKLLEDRLKEMEQGLENRQKNRDASVDKFLDRFLDPRGAGTDGDDVAGDDESSDAHAKM